MATSTWSETVPELRDGDRLSVAEFERRCHASPQIRKAELIEGVVYVAPSVTDDHGPAHSTLDHWFGYYQLGTPHLTCSSDGTVRLDAANQFQPDLHLRIAPGYGGQATRSVDRYVEGAPELVAEIAVTTAARDLKEKLEVYRRNGAREYIVWRVWDRAIDWFVLHDGRYDRLPLGEDGLYRSEVFPGLWLDPDALLRGDHPALFRAVQLGLATPEHAAFVEELARRGGGRP